RVPDEKRLAWAKEVVAGLGGRKVQSQPEIYAREAVLLHETPEVELKIQALRVGDGGIATMPNEVFAISGLKVKSASPLRPTMVVTLANGAEGYIPPPEQHALGGYTTWPARTAALEVGAEPRIVETAVQLLEQASGKPRVPFSEPDSPYAKAVLASKPIAYWRLGELSGPLLADASGHGRAAEVEGAVALHLDGPPFPGAAAPNRGVQMAGGRLRIPELALGDAWTVELWFQDVLPADSDVPRGWLLRRALADGPPEDGLGVRPGRQHAIGFKKRFPGSRAEGDAGNPGPARAWAHLVVTFDAGSMRIYVDNQEILHLASAAPRLGPLRLGGLDGEPGFEGRLDEVAVYDRALSPLEVAAHLRSAR
ncbi:MAG TPA: LamG domain-containing protein, partial [Planctomycetota bacterium]|nr:LamG domain-containing protein [Planctomycetota bacterium]